MDVSADHRRRAAALTTRDAAASSIYLAPTSRVAAGYLAGVGAIARQDRRFGSTLAYVDEGGKGPDLFVDGDGSNLRIGLDLESVLNLTPEQLRRFCFAGLAFADEADALAAAAEPEVTTTVNLVESEGEPRRVAQRTLLAPPGTPQPLALHDVIDLQTGEVKPPWRDVTTPRPIEPPEPALEFEERAYWAPLSAPAPKGISDIIDVDTGLPNPPWRDVTRQPAMPARGHEVTIPVPRERDLPIEERLRRAAATWDDTLTDPAGWKRAGNFVRIGVEPGPRSLRRAYWGDPVALQSDEEWNTLTPTQQAPWLAASKLAKEIR